MPLMKEEEESEQTWIVQSASQASAVRYGLTTWLRSRGAPEHTVDDLLVVVNELITNGIEAGIAAGRVWVRVDARPNPRGVVVHVRNQGLPYRQVNEPGPMPPPSQLGGRGLSIVMSLTSSFEIAGQIGGTDARVELRLPRRV